MRFFEFRLMVSRNYVYDEGLMMMDGVVVVVLGRLILEITIREANRFGLLLEGIVERVLMLVLIYFSLNVLRIRMCIVLFWQCR